MGTRIVLVPIVAAIVAAMSTYYIRTRPNQDSDARPAGHMTKLHTGDEIVAVFIGSSTCGATRRSGLPAAWDSLAKELASQATARGESFTTVGVAVDWDPVVGIKFLTGFSRFDEVSAGNNWLNMGAVQYIWRGVPGLPSIPQVLVIERHVTEGTTTMDVGSDHLLARRVGWKEIMDWTQRGGRVQAQDTTLQSRRSL